MRAAALRQPAAVQAAFAAITASEVRLITALNNEIARLGEVVAEHFGRHPDAEIYASQPGLGVILGARVLAEFGDDPHRFADAQSPQELRRHLTDHQSLRHEESRARPLRHATPASPTRCSSGPSDHCADHPAPAPTTTQLRARKIGHQAALRQLANRNVGILHGCLKTRTLYDENTAWGHRNTAAA